MDSVRLATGWAILLATCAKCWISGDLCVAPGRHVCTFEAAHLAAPIVSRRQGAITYQRTHTSAGRCRDSALHLHLLRKIDGGS